MIRTRWLGIALVLLAVVLAGGYALLRPDAGPEAPAGAVTQEPAAAPTASTETIILLHTNDFHGAIAPQQGTTGSNASESGGLINLASLVYAERARDPDRTVVLDAGDSFQGTFVSNSTQGALVMAAMNLMAYDAWTLGNHEFDWGQDVLRTRISQAEFPVLAANVLDSASGQQWDPTVPFTIVQAGRLRVGILGLTYPDTPTINRPQNVSGLRFLPAAEATRLYLPDLEAQADLVVVLSHLGYDGDRALAASVDGIDVIVGGHSHLFIEQPRVVNSTLIVQAGAKGEVLGRLELTVDIATGEIQEYSRRQVLLPVSNAVSTVSQDVKRLVDEAMVKAADTLNQPIGATAAPLEPQRAGEFALGNLIVDAMLAADIDGQPADIAFHNNGGIRASLPMGSISFGQLYEVLPFDNQLMAMDLTGVQILQILEHSVADRAGSLQVAGMAFTFSMSRPVGQRVLEATVAGQSLNPARLYRVVTIDYLASGGEGYETFIEGSSVSYGDTEVWSVAEYVRAHSPVKPRVEGRIVQR